MKDQIPIIDMHCDTISVIHDQRLQNQEIGLRENPLHVDLKRMKSSNYLCQNFALFTYLGNWFNQDGHYAHAEVKNMYHSPYDYACSLSNTLDKEMRKNKDLIRMAVSGSEIEENMKNGFMSGLKTIEEGAVFEDQLEKLDLFYQKGVRMTTLTWNYENNLAYPNQIDLHTGRALPDTVHGLKPIGREFVEYCREIGILLDISHLNDAGIYDIFDIYDGKTPIVASHSNARAVTNQARNLSDDMLRRLANCGGVTGINFCADFLNDRADQVALIEDMVRHILHIEHVAGIDAIGLGSDMDGIENLIEFKDCSGIQLLAQALESAGYSIDKIEKIFYKNVLRVYKDVLG